MFGRVYSTEDRLPSLEEAGRKRLYDAAAPPCAELRRMNKELLTLFMQLVKDLCQPLPPDAPEQPHLALVQEIEDTFVNMQHLINVMRPAQAAMDLKTILDRQTVARKEMTEKLNESVKRSWELIGDAAEKLTEPSVDLAERTKAPFVDEADKADPASNGKSNILENGKEEDDEMPSPLSQVLAKIAQVLQDPTL